MFRFGKYIKPVGPYRQYAQAGSGRSYVTAKTASFTKANTTSIKSDVTKLEASCLPAGSSGGGGSSGAYGNGASGGGSGGSGNIDASYTGGGAGGAGSGYNTDRFNPVFDRLEEGSVLEDWIPRDGAGLDALFRRIYLRDPTIGPGVDLIRTLPWSPWYLSGIKDPAILKVYQDCLEQLDLMLLMPDVTGDFLTIGRNIISLVFDPRKGIFSGIIPHDPDFIRVTPLPLYGMDPICDFKLSPGFKRFMTSTDPRAMDARKALPRAFVDAAQSENGFLPLDPVSTVYLARKASQHDSIGTSLLTRTLYFWGIEKALLNAQLTSTRRRARSFMHLTAGVDNVWEPTAEDIDNLAAMLIQANEDPVGGVVATRTGVTINEPVGGGADFYKWSDELELFAKYKMQAIGISDALLGGEGTYNSREQARSVFVEMLSTLRYRLTDRMFTQKIFPTIAKLHGFVKRTPAELNHRIRTTSNNSLPDWARLGPDASRRLTERQMQSVSNSNLIVPNLNWEKQLKPTQDDQALETLERVAGQGFPVTLAQWAMAAGLNHANLKQDVETDAKLREEIKTLQEGPGGTAKGGDNVDQNVDDINQLLDEELPPASEEQPEGEEVQQSVYSRVKNVYRKPRRVEEVQIWNNGVCGPLRLVEAKTTLKKMIREHDRSLWKDSREVLNYLVSSLGEKKAQVMIFVLNRLGLTKLPVEASVAREIESSVKSILGSSTFTTTRGAIKLKSAQLEMALLSSYSNKKSTLKHEGVSKVLASAGAPSFAPNLMSGVS